MADLSELIARLQKADRPSRPEDCHLWVIAQGGDARMYYVDGDARNFVWERGIDGMWVRGVVKFGSVPKYTSSIDAAVALAERVLPGWGWSVESKTHHIMACLNPDLGEPVGKHPHWAAVSNTSSRQFEDAATPAMALVLATLRALQQKGSSNG